MSATALQAFLLIAFPELSNCLSRNFPADRTVVRYCWDIWCSQAAQATVPLLERDYDVKELYGGIKAWKTLKFPTEPVDAEALVKQVVPI